MLGKVRSFAIALLFVGLLGASAQALDITNSTEYWFDAAPPAPEGVNISGSTVNIWHTVDDGSGNVVLTTGDTNSMGNINITDSTILIELNDTFYINSNAPTGYTPSLVFKGTNANAVTGALTATKFDMSVLSDLNLTDATITVGNFHQGGGTIAGLGGTNTIITEASTNGERELINGANSVFAVNGMFRDGVTFTNGATLLGASNTIGTDGTGNGIQFQNAIMDLSKDKLTVTDSVTFTGASNLILGATNASVNQLTAITAGTAVTGNLAQIVSLDSSYSTYYHNNYTSFTNPLNANQHRFILGSVTGSNEWTVSNVFGDFTFKYDDSVADSGAWLTAYNKTDVNDLGTVASQLGKTFSDSLISTGIAADASAVANDILANAAAGTASTMAYSEGGLYNYAALEAMANGNRSFSWDSNGVTKYGIVDKGLVAAMNGSNLSGVNYVAQDVARDIFTSLHARLDAYRAVAIEIGSTQGLGSVADTLNDRYLNRFWAGGVGSWTDAKKRKGHEGYKYDGKGVMLGYDKAFRNMVVGIAGAYIEGDYEDKAASNHDSEIKNYSVNAYFTANASNGFFATLSGGWVYSDNDIRERRGGLWTTQDYHTNTWHAEAKLGHDFQPCDNWVVSPSVGVNFIHAKGSAHSLEAEGVAGSLRSYSSAKNHLVEIPVEIQAEYEVQFSDVTRVTFMANGGYAYNLNDHAIRGMSVTDGLYGVQSSQVIGRKLGHSSWKAGAGIKVRHDNWDLGVKYDYYGRNKYHAHRVMGTIGYSF